MRALIGGSGPDWQLADREKPSQLGAIRVQVMAAGINRADLYALAGTYTANSQQQGEYVAGMEVAGIVETSSPLAPHLPAGTRVMGITAAAFADYALCDPRLVVPIPDGLTFEDAADVTVNTAAEELAATVLAATDGAGVDITLDHVGGELFAALPDATAVGGTIISIGRLAGPATQLNLDTVAFRRQRVLGTTFSIRTRAELADVVGALSTQVLPALADGRIVPRVDAVYPPERAVEAAKRLRGNGALGKIVLSFADAHAGPAPAPVPRANMFGTIAQIGYVVRDIEASMAGFIESGIGPWFYLKNVQPGNFTYRGRPSGMAMDVAVANSGDIQIELIQPVNDEPSMYKDFLDAGHEGLQHFAYWSENYQQLYDRALAVGFTVGQEGEIGGPTGRFAYLETEHHPGTVIEISDLDGSKKFAFDLIKLAAANWDGSNPIQIIDPTLLSGDPEAMAGFKEAMT